MNAVQLSGALPRNPHFREWCASHAEVEPLTVDQAAEFIRVVCQVDSRRELATNAEAAQRFHNLIRRPFVEFCEQLEQTV